MPNSQGPTPDNLLRALPSVLQQDENVLALAQSIANILGRRPEEIARLCIYPRIDSLPDQLLDVLAYDFKVDWWDGSYSTAEKQATLRESWRVHRLLGTKAAVERAISAIYPGAKVLEWWDYKGEPYHFKIRITLDDVRHESDKFKQVLERIRYYKNLRSVLDVVEYTVTPIKMPNPPPVLHLRDFHIFARFANYGDDFISLDGERVLDGGWLLNQSFRGVAFTNFSVGVKLQEQERISVAMQLGGIAKFVNSSTLKSSFEIANRLAVCNTMDLRGLSVAGLRFVESEKLGAVTLTRDSMWRLDGTTTLGGERRLNAEIKKETI